MEVLTAILTVVCTILTSIIIPLYGTLKTKKKEWKQKDDTISKLPGELAYIKDGIEYLKQNQLAIADQQEEQTNKFDSFETQMLKYMINDAFFGYETVQDIPDEVLINASQCADIYLGKGLNHETGARCKIIYAELERRQVEKANSKK